MTSIVNVLPIEILDLILSKTDILESIRFISTCKLTHKHLNIKNYIAKRSEIIFSEKMTLNKHVCKNLNHLTHKIKNWIIEYKYTTGQLYIWKKFRHKTILRNIQLVFTKNRFNECSFIINNIDLQGYKYQFLQCLYEPGQTRYRLCYLNNSGSSMKIPYFLLYIGLRVLFDIHGYEYISSFDNIYCEFNKNVIDEWFRRLIVYQNYDGKIINKIIHSYIEI